jgi:hypothetical protein
MHIPNGTHGLFSTCIQKKRGPVIHIHGQLLFVTCYHNSLIHIPLHTYLSSQALAALQQMSPPLLSSQGRLSCFTYQLGRDTVGRLAASHQWLGFTVFGSAWSDLTADRCPSSDTYKSHRYISRLNVRAYSCRAIHIHKSH